MSCSLALRRVILLWFMAAAIVCCLIAAHEGAAAPVNASRARAVAANWLAFSPRPLGASLGRRVTRITAYAGAAGSVAYYVASLDPSGFVVVSADDLVEPIICFAPSGSFDPSPTNPLGALVTSDMDSRLALIRSTGTKTLDAASRGLFLANRRKWSSLQGRVTLSGARPLGLTGPISDERVTPLLQSKWSQETVSRQACYNYYTPPGASGDASNYPCGCVATAMAQLMRFHQYPTVGVGPRSFAIKVDGASQTRSLHGGDGAGGPYDYSLMPLVPLNGTTLAQRQQIGALCHDAGISVGMEYKADGSSASLQQSDTAMVDVFKFANSIFGHNNMADLGAGLAAMVNPNLDAGLPVLLAVHKGQDGHAVVCDGYGYNASTLYHHLNLGWAGLDDAWYNLPNLDAPSGAYDTVDQCVYNAFPTETGEIISGRVTDTLGNPVPDATVTAQRDGGGTYTTTTNARGIYALAKIPSSSTYTITVEKPYYTFTSRTTFTGKSMDDHNVAGNVWGVNFSGTYDRDITSPTCTVTGPTSPTSTWPVAFSITFSEAVQGLSLAKVIITGAVPVALTGAGASYTVTATPSAGGQVTCKVPAGAARDLAGNASVESNTASVIFQDPPPSVAFTNPAGSCSRNCSALSIRGTAADNGSLQSVRWSNDRGGSGICQGTAQWSADVTLVAGTNVITVFATDSAGLTGSTSVTVDYTESSPGAAWQGRAMVSLPIVPDQVDPGAVVGFQGSGWYAYDPLRGYLGYADTRSWFDPASATPGRGFWAYFAAGADPGPCGTIPAQDQAAVINLKAGWNLIGLPFIKSVAWNPTAITVRYGGSTKPLAEARDAVADYAWGWDSAAETYYLVCDPTWYYPGSIGEMRPWQAYWVRAYKDCDLILPAP